MTAPRGKAQAATSRSLKRFTSVAADQIDYEFTVEDPVTWDQPWERLGANDYNRRSNV